MLSVSETSDGCHGGLLPTFPATLSYQHMHNIILLFNFVCMLMQSHAALMQQGKSTLNECEFCID